MRTALNFPEKLAIQRNLRTLEKKRDSAWREYDEAVRGIDKQKDALIDQTQARLKQNIEAVSYTHLTLPTNREV